MNKRLYLLLLGLALVGLAGLGLRSGAFSKDEIPAAARVGSATELQGPAQVYAAAPVELSAPTRSLPAVDRGKWPNEFRELKDCMTYRRFSALFASQKDNPSFPLNNDEAFRAMPRAEQNLLMDRVQTVRDHAADCEAWASSIADEAAIFMIYQSAFAAAQRGDLEAGVCYAMAPWGFPDSPADQSTALKNQYVRYAKGFIDRGIQDGRWPAVIAANNIVNEQHGPSSSVDWPPVEAYVFARLLQMGMSDQDLSSAYGFEAAGRAENMNAESLEAGDRLAGELFRSKFGGRLMSDVERYENCGN